MRKKVLFLTPHFGGGGAERVTERLAAGLSPDKYEIHFCVLMQSDAAPTELPDSVIVHGLGVSRIRYAALPLMRLIWRIKPAIVFSGHFPQNFLVLLLRPFLPGGSRCVLRQIGLTTDAAETAPLTRLLYRMLYPYAQAIVCQSQAMADELAVLLGRRSEKTKRKLRILPNPVRLNEFVDEPGSADVWNGPGPNLLAIGRLVRGKGFDLLITAFAEVLRHYPTANLTILGQGPEKDALCDLSHVLGLRGRVRFPGYVEAPERWFSGASLFALSSRYEAMSNALLEAAAAGVPIVATPAAGGMDALLRGQPGAWVAESVSAEALANSLCEALTSLGPHARVTHAWLAPFHAENALAGYERLFDEVLSGAII